MRIMLIGKQRAGKDTIGDYLSKEYDFFKMALAEPIYDLARGLFGMQEKDRELLIQIGNKMREIKPTVWVDYLLRDIYTIEAFKDVWTAIPINFVVTDVRFQNEFDMLLANGFIPVKVVASQEVRSQRPGYTPEYENHFTEQFVETVKTPYVIVNEGSFEDLYEAVDLLITELRAEDSI